MPWRSDRRSQVIGEVHAEPLQPLRCLSRFNPETDPDLPHRILDRILLGAIAGGASTNNVNSR